LRLLLALLRPPCRQSTVVIAQESGGSIAVVASVAPVGGSEFLRENRGGGDGSSI
jgi:hypothetical protein